jgi:hypothetical protein
MISQLSTYQIREAAHKSLVEISYKAQEFEYSDKSVHLFYQALSAFGVFEFLQFGVLSNQLFLIRFPVAVSGKRRCFFQ